MRRAEKEPQPQKLKAAEPEPGRWKWEGQQLGMRRRVEHDCCNPALLLSLRLRNRVFLWSLPLSNSTSGQRLKPPLHSLIQKDSAIPKDLTPRGPSPDCMGLPPGCCHSHPL